MKAQYFLNIRSFQANFEIRINDVLVESDFKNRNVTYAVPVNHWLRQGQNALSLTLLPHDGESRLRLKARMEVAIQRGTATGQGGALEMSDHYTLWSQDISGEFDEPAPLFTHTGFFEIAEQLSLPWDRGAEIRATGQELQLVMRTFEKLHQLMVSKDAAGFVDLTRRKIADCAAALDWDLQEDLRFSHEHFTEVFNKPGYVVWPLTEQQLIPSVEALGRLVTLRNEKKQPPLLLYNEEAGTCIFIDVKLYRPENGSELVVIR